MDKWDVADEIEELKVMYQAGIDVSCPYCHVDYIVHSAAPHVCPKCNKILYLINLQEPQCKKVYDAYKAGQKLDNCPVCGVYIPWSFSKIICCWACNEELQRQAFGGLITSREVAERERKIKERRAALQKNKTIGDCLIFGTGRISKLTKKTIKRRVGYLLSGT